MSSVFVGIYAFPCPLSNGHLWLTQVGVSSFSLVMVIVSVRSTYLYHGDDDHRHIHQHSRITRYLSHVIGTKRPRWGDRLSVFVVHAECRQPRDENSSIKQTE